MTREEAKRRLLNIERSLPNTFRTKEDVRNFEALEMAINALESDRIEYGTDGNAYKLWMSNGKEYEPSGDLISRQAVLEMAYDMSEIDGEHFTEPCMVVDVEDIKKLPSVNPQEKTGHCKDCKWWKDSDGAFRRGIDAESKCPINRIEVYEGNGYCFLYEPQERSK